MHESPISLESLRRSRGTFADAVGLPPAVYSDAEFHRFEIDAVFGSEWLCVGRSEQIPNAGDYLAVTRGGEPLIVVLDPTGPTSHELSMAYLLPESTVRLPLFDQLLEAAIAGVANFNRQDMPTNIAVQRGMQSRFAPRSRYSWQEGVLPQFNSWLVDRYESHAGQ